MMILDLYRQGLSVAVIARQTGKDAKTIRRYIAGAVWNVVENAVMGVSGGLRLTAQAARSMTASVGLVASVCQPSTLRMVICPEASSAQNNRAAVSSDGNTVWILMRSLTASTNEGSG